VPFGELGPESLLRTFWSYADFTAIRSPEQFDRHFQPFTPQSCLQVSKCSRAGLVVRTVQLEPSPLGFAASSPSVAAKACSIEHRFPWVPALDDWGALLDVLLLSPVPQWVIVRVSNGADAGAAARQLGDLIQVCELFLNSALGDQVTLTSHIQSMREVCRVQASRLAENALRVAVLLLAPGNAARAIAGVLGQSISGDLGRGTAGLFEEVSR